MKSFIKKVVCTLICLLIINTLLDFKVSYQLQHCKGSLYSTWNEISYNDINADLLIMGNSRAEWQYNPLILDSMLHTNSYIIGYSGSGINEQIIKYNVYNHYQKRKPTWLIINIDYFITLTWSYGFQREQLFPYLVIPYTRKEILYVEPFNLCEKYIPVYRYTTYKGIYKLLTEDAKVVDNTIKGYTPCDAVWNPAEYEKVKSFHFQADRRSIKMFDDFLRERQNEGVKVIFCYAPIYIGLTHKLDNLQTMYDTYQYYANKYGIQIIDYTFSEISRDTTCFFNATHLNKKGAELFTTQLAHDLDSLGIVSH